MTSTTSQPGRRYPKGELRRRQILEAAVEVFSRGGFRGGSLREIAKRVGLTPTGVMHYFASKEELFAEVVRERDERVRRVAGEAGGPEVLEQMRRVVAHNAETPGLGSLYTVVTAEATDPEHPLHPEFAARYAEGADQSEANLRAAQRVGAVRDDLDVVAAARLITAVMDGLQLAALLDDRVDMPVAFEEFLAGYLAPR